MAKTSHNEVPGFVVCSSSSQVSLGHAVVALECLRGLTGKHFSVPNLNRISGGMLVLKKTPLMSIVLFGIGWTCQFWKCSQVAFPISLVQFAWFLYNGTLISNKAFLFSTLNVLFLLSWGTFSKSVSFTFWMLILTQNLAKYSSNNLTTACMLPRMFLNFLFQSSPFPVNSFSLKFSGKADKFFTRM